MYKGILDSGWVDLNSLTVFVGKNESGKTSLLKALHKLNPDNPEPYQIIKEWPRGHRRERSPEHVVCRAKFHLSDQEQSELAQIVQQKKFPDIVEVSRNYAGNLEVKFEKEILPDSRHPDDIDNAFETLPKIQDAFGDAFKECVEECLEEAKLFAHEEQFTELLELAQKHNSLLQQAISPSEPPQQIENNFISQYIVGLEQLIQTLEPLPTIQLKVREYIINHLPTFVYMDDYRVFNGTANLDDIKVRKDQQRLTEADETFLTILDLSGLDLNGLITSEQTDDGQIEERQYDLADAASSLTRTISKRFRQRRYEVEYRVDGQNFFTYIKDDHDPSLVLLEERSKGFQWFFSFELMFMHETKGTFKDCVILLDEPGLHLHPNAQKDFLLRLEEYSEGNTLLYSTHLPFMIDLNHPDRIRVLTETDNGIVVMTDFTESDPEAKLVLHGALGMDASQSFLVTDRNLVVESVNDYWVLTELSNLLMQDGIGGLPGDVLITPAGSAATVVNVATIMIGKNLNVVALFDSDDEGRSAKNKLNHNWLMKYKPTQTVTIMLGEAVGASGDFALEDLFPENFIIDFVKDAYKRQLAAADIDEILLDGKEILWRRIERFMGEHGIEINKGPIAKRLQNKLSKMKDTSELPDETREQAIKLFQAIRSAFGEADSEFS